MPSPQNSGYKGLINDFDGKTAVVPVWWYLLHMVSKGTTQAMIASIPCGNQLRQLRFEVQNTKIRDPIVRQEVQDFADQCYSRAYFKLKNSHHQLSDATINSVGWVGSRYFLNTAGYYDHYTSTEPRSQWSYNRNRDSGYPEVERGGYPTCKQWWADGTYGLKTRVLANLNGYTQKALRFMYHQDQWEEMALRWLVSPRNVGLSGRGETYAVSGNDVTSGLMGNITRLISSVGLGLKQTEALSGFDALKQALPMIQALLEMMIIIVIPLLLMFSAYEPKTVVTLSFALFALIFITFWWELAGWLDDRLITILYDNMADQGIINSSVPFAGFFSSTADGWMMNLVLGMMYVIFPMFWLTLLSWVGVRIGDIARAISDGGKMPQAAGESGGKTAAGAARTVISKG